MLLPRFVQEGKKYASVAVGCTGGRHRSVYVVRLLAARLRAATKEGQAAPWRVSVTHRELSLEELAQGGIEAERGQAPSQRSDTDRHGAGPLDTGVGGLKHIP